MAGRPFCEVCEVYFHVPARVSAPNPKIVDSMLTLLGPSRLSRLMHVLLTVASPTSAKCLRTNPSPTVKRFLVTSEGPS